MRYVCVYYKTITILGTTIPLEINRHYDKDKFIPDAIRLDKQSVEQEIISYLCWMQFLESKSASDKIQSYFCRVAHEYAKDIILHLKQ